MEKILALIVVGLLLYTSMGITGEDVKSKVEEKREVVITTSKKVEKEIDIQPVIDNIKNDKILPLPWGWVWMGILEGDWSYLVFYNENGTSESGIGVELTYKIVAIGYHHIEVKGDYVLSGDFENLKDYYGNFSFPEDSFIFIMKKKTIPLSFPGADGMYFDAYLYIDGRRWGSTSIIAP
ncbi:MAG TPA: hypothetical protein ENI33_05575 [Thermoplasmatales archaeon]|nr:hypothetical protein [Thermoplasmatales archaeon]